MIERINKLFKKQPKIYVAHYYDDRGQYIDVLEFYTLEAAIEDVQFNSTVCNGAKIYSCNFDYTNAKYIMDVKAAIKDYTYTLRNK